MDSVMVYLVCGGCNTSKHHQHSLPIGAACFRHFAVKQLVSVLYKDARHMVWCYCSWDVAPVFGTDFLDQAMTSFLHTVEVLPAIVCWLWWWGGVGSWPHCWAGLQKFPVAFRNTMRSLIWFVPIERRKLHQRDSVTSTRFTRSVLSFQRNCSHAACNVAVLLDTQLLQEKRKRE